MRLPLPILLLTPMILCAGDPAVISQRFTAGGRSEQREVKRIVLSVPKGGAVSPKLPAGPFEARWEGRINAARRAEYVFVVKVRGSLKVTINGRLEIEGAGTGMAHPMDKTLQLETGDNPFVVEFSSDGAEDAVLELDWKPR
jgi:hypothetical protein